MPDHYEKELDQVRKSDSIEYLGPAFEELSEPLLVISRDYKIKLINKAARDFYRTTCPPGDELSCHKLIFGLDHPCGEEERTCSLKSVQESGKAATIEHEHTRRDGTHCFYEIHATPLHNNNGDFIGVIQTLNDITLQKEASSISKQNQEELDKFVLDLTAEYLQKKEQAELLYRVIPSAIFTVDTERIITSWNNKAEDVTGFRAAKVLGKTCSMFALEPCTNGCGVFSEEISKPIMGRECQIRTKAGKVLTVSKNADVLRDSKGKIIGAVESFEDITDRKLMVQQIKAERDKFMSMFSGLNHGMHILNSDYIIEYQNEILKDDFGDQIGRKCYEVYKQLDEPCEVCRMKEAINSNELQRTELMMSNGRYYKQSYAPFVDIDGESKVLILLRDISEEKSRQAERMRAAQMASIGELAAGVAHEINNPINGIINYAQILLDEEQTKPSNINTDEHNTFSLLPKIIGEGERIATIVSNLLSFTRQENNEEVKNIDLVEVMASTIELINHQLSKEGIVIAFEKMSDIPAVQGSRQQLQQVFLNLLNNSRDALNKRFPENDLRKKIEVMISPILLENKNFIRTTITDYGCGISREHQPHIFEPYFTSKETGKGTGLGLSISLGLIKDMKGSMSVESEVDTFTKMNVDLPESKEATDDYTAENS